MKRRWIYDIAPVLKRADLFLLPLLFTLVAGQSRKYKNILMVQKLNMDFISIN